MPVATILPTNVRYAPGSHFSQFPAVPVPDDDGRNPQYGLPATRLLGSLLSSGQNLLLPTPDKLDDYWTSHDFEPNAIS